MIWTQACLPVDPLPCSVVNFVSVYTHAEPSTDVLLLHQDDSQYHWNVGGLVFAWNSFFSLYRKDWSILQYSSTLVALDFFLYGLLKSKYLKTDWVRSEVFCHFRFLCDIPLSCMWCLSVLHKNGTGVIHTKIVMQYALNLWISQVHEFLCHLYILCWVHCLN
jgi:hypothetical protein